MAADIVNTFADAYKSGAQIGQYEEQKRLAEDTKNVFADVLSKKDKFGGEEGALAEAAKRFGESGNVEGFNLVTQRAVAVKAEKDKKLAESTSRLGSAAIWLYGEKDPEVKKEKYKYIRDSYKSAGGDISTWPEPDKYTDEFGLSAIKQKEGVELWEGEFVKKGTVKARQTEADAELERAKRGVGKGGRGGTGSKTSIIQNSEYIYENLRKPDGSRYTRDEAYAKAEEQVLLSKRLSREQYELRAIKELGMKAGKALTDRNYPPKEGDSSTERIKVKSPDGKLFTIPKSQLEEAKNQGYTEVK